MLHVGEDVDDLGEVKPKEWVERLFVAAVVVVITGRLLSGVTLRDDGCDAFEGAKPSWK